MEAREGDQRRFREVLESLPVCVALLTPDHRVSSANRMFRERFGETYGPNCFETASGLKAPCEFLETTEPHDWECACRDGSIYHVFASPHQDTEGSNLILEVRIDMTEVKRAHAKVEEQVALLQLAPDAILVTDLESRVAAANSYLPFCMERTQQVPLFNVHRKKIPDGQRAKCFRRTHPRSRG